MTPPQRSTSASAQACAEVPLRRYRTPRACPRLDNDLLHERFSLDGQVRSLEGGPKVRNGCAAPSSVSYGLLHTVEAMLLCAIAVRDDRVARASYCLFKSVMQRIGKRGSSHREGSFAAAIVARTPLPAFRALEVRQNVGKCPAFTAELPPSVIVVAVAANIGHGVHRRGAPDHAASSAFDLAAIQMRLRLGKVAPVVQSLPEDFGKAERNVDEGVSIPASRLEKQNPSRGILGESMRERAPRGSGTDDDVIERARWVGCGHTQPCLVRFLSSYPTGLSCPGANVSRSRQT